MFIIAQCSKLPTKLRSSQDMLYASRRVLILSSSLKNYHHIHPLSLRHLQLSLKVVLSPKFGITAYVVPSIVVLLSSYLESTVPLSPCPCTLPYIWSPPQVQRSSCPQAAEISRDELLQHPTVICLLSTPFRLCPASFPNSFLSSVTLSLQS